MLSHEDLTGAAVLVFANKQDLKDALTAEELTEKLSLHAIKTHDWHIQSCCAVSGKPPPANDSELYLGAFLFLCFFQKICLPAWKFLPQKV